MYTCGPTVYDFAHIGNFRTFTFVDLLRSGCALSGFQLNHVMNITDVDDKIIRNARGAGTSLDEYTTIYTEAFLEDCATLRLERPERLVPATEHIHDMVEAIQRLGEQTATPMPATARVYFRIANFPEYGKLSQTTSAATSPARASMSTSTTRTTPATSSCGRPAKKASPSGTPPIGPGRPGWHIECSVMAIKYLGETLDIHAGGIDLVFPTP